MIKVVLFFFCMIVFVGFSQGTITIHGTVKDASSKEALIGATVFSATHGKGIITNGYGFYSLTLPKKDTLVLLVNYIGFKPKKLTLDGSKQNISLDVLLNSGIYMKEFVVEEDEITKLKNPDKSVVLEVEEIKKCQISLEK